MLREGLIEIFLCFFLNLRRLLTSSIIAINYSMKYQKSSYSLHTTSTSVLREKPANILFNASSKFQFKRQPSYSKGFTSIFNARGRLNHSSQLLTDLKQLSSAV